ncbi:hypothetical protein LCI18_007358 [Fusarium solani-melongenae]|uniref:Uncharacterized protein n=1 Tax=Fusarium solani subsp. cucurbitae TaxID=2747967 RepID=A0ACD3Z8L7_FUSSC|nr:hypothetical protein LCI18_007358 [Fusarium solani-melongenae]
MHRGRWLTFPQSPFVSSLPVIVRSRKALNGQYWRVDAQLGGFLTGQRGRLRSTLLQLWSTPPHGKDSTTSFWSQNRSLPFPPSSVLKQNAMAGR